MGVFRNHDRVYFDQILDCGKYYPYRQWDGSKNPRFDAHSGHILDVKEAQPAAVAMFVQHLNKHLAEGIPIAVVPSHSAGFKATGIRLISQQLAALNRIDATRCLCRKTEIEKLAGGGRRDISVHLETIEVLDPQLFAGREVVLLDDVCTSGNSLNACAQLLLKAGAAAVQRLCLGETTRD